MIKLLVRLAIGVLFALFGLFNYVTTVSENPITGERQRVALTPQEEVVLGQQGSQEVVQSFGGLYPDPVLQSYVDQVGQQVVSRSAAAQSSYSFEFHLLNDPDTVNALALPGGQIFVTTGLLRQLTAESQLAGVLGHEIGHVIARHGSEHLARRQLGVALVNAVGVAASDDPTSGRQAAMIAQAVNQLVNLNYGRQDELESDRLGFDFMTAAEYNPEGLVELMEILDQASEGGRPPEFLSSHPNPGNRVERLEALIQETYPQGVPPALEEGQQNFSQTVPPRLR
ncbi:M48 family metallopeptidase [Nodosilinea sp. E11]|uniref:M48 family metallopeptidase n=1 Tax=Nodosilinea sp. E11 TaxID=3037479 RepID=UPI002934E316|nr:M48 family metallopeptidase [Nodosilinea sp. E11]WOD36958.1 M48 family metallopeptidase [Nodosilinea sp. E11]